MSVLLKFQEKFRVNEYKLYETEYWIWSLRPHQVTIGSGILSLKRECSALGELNEYEFTDLKNMISKIETTLKITFDYDVINYLLLMMMDKHVHYHILPRYEKSVYILGDTWIDEQWPAVPTLLGKPLSDEKLEKLSILIRSKL